MKINLLEVWKGCCHIKMKEHNDRIWLFFRDICLSWKGFFFLVAKTRHYHVLSRQFSLSLRRCIMAAAPFPPLYQIRAPPDRHATSFECFFLSGDFAFNCSPVDDEELGQAGDVLDEMSFGRSPTVIPSFMTVTLCLLPNFSPSGSGCIVSFSSIVDPVDNDSLE